MNDELLGRWVMTGPEEIRVAEFSADGTMSYRIEAGGREMAMSMQYRVAGSEIITDRGVNSRFTIHGDVLTMEHGGETFVFTRISM
ncbi:MAG TPA: hypothetical protein VGR02_10660 [Thermoanaerobaculia bacterium]|jgi:hypothetical protein|nr:hypothetical protein [Thermoanaerobaculia bacterium]